MMVPNNGSSTRSPEGNTGVVRGGGKEACRHREDESGRQLWNHAAVGCTKILRKLLLQLRRSWERRHRTSFENQAHGHREDQTSHHHAASHLAAADTRAETHGGEEGFSTRQASLTSGRCADFIPCSRRPRVLSCPPFPSRKAYQIHNQHDSHQS